MNLFDKKYYVTIKYNIWFAIILFASSLIAILTEDILITTFSLGGTIAITVFMIIAYFKGKNGKRN